MAAEQLSDVTRRIAPTIRAELCARAAGRCEFAGCSKFVFEHPLTRRDGNFAELAHIVAFSPRGPRAAKASGTKAVHQIENLMLLCLDCHTEIDRHPDRYPVATLGEYKQSHETRVHHVTGLGPDLRTAVVQVKANIAGQAVGIPAPQVYDAVAPRYPASTPGFVIDLTNLNFEGEAFYAAATKQVGLAVGQLFQPGTEASTTRHISLFALAPIPLLVFLGGLLGNKVTVEAFQRHRDTGDWKWKPDGDAVSYAFNVGNPGTDAEHVALVLSLSGRIDRSALPPIIDSSFTIYELTLLGTLPSPTYLRRCEDFARFGVAYRDALATLRARHPGLRELHLFAAIPAPVAVACGRELLPKVDPILLVYDFDKVNGFTQCLKVNQYDPR